MTTNARIITAATVATAGAAMYRDQAAVAYFTDLITAQQLVSEDEIGNPFEAVTANAKSAKPRFEIHERQIEGSRAFRMTLMQRNNANKMSEIDSIQLGLYGKRLDAPAKQPAEPKLTGQALLDAAVAEHMAENPDADEAIVALEMEAALAS